MQNTEPVHNSFVREWLVFCLSFLLVGGLLSSLIVYERDQAVTNQQARLIEQSAAIHDLVAHQFDAVRQTLQRLRDGLPRLRQQSTQTTSEQLKAFVEAMPTVRTLSIVDATGIVLASNHDSIIGRNFSHRDYFRVPQVKADPQTLYVSPPFKSALGAWTLNLTQVVLGPKGEFAGVVTASLEADEFKVILNAVRYADDFWSGLAHGDGILWMLVPNRDGVSGKNLAVPDSFFTRHRDGGQSVSVFSGQAHSTGERRLMVVRTLQPAELVMDRPFQIGVSRDLDIIYSGWWWQTRLHIAGFVATLLLCGIGLHISQRLRLTAELELREARTELANFFAVAPDLLCIADLAGHFRRLNRSWEKVLGHSIDEMVGNKFMVYVHHDDVEATTAALVSLQQGKTIVDFINRYRHRDNNYRYIQWNAVSHNGLIYAAARDVTQQKEAELQLRFMAYHDRLTGLPNRCLFFDRFTQAIAHARRHQKRLGLLFIDLDGFKEINDQEGHEAGDLVLKTVAERFLSSVRAIDTVARIGGDEFVVLFGELSNSEEAVAVAAKLRDSLIKPFNLPDGRVRTIGASFGISLYPDHGTEMDSLLAQADNAMYRSKQCGSGLITLASHEGSHEI